MSVKTFEVIFWSVVGALVVFFPVLLFWIVHFKVGKQIYSKKIRRFILFCFRAVSTFLFIPVFSILLNGALYPVNINGDTSYVSEKAVPIIISGGLLCFGFAVSILLLTFLNFDANPLGKGRTSMVNGRAPTAALFLFVLLSSLSSAPSKLRFLRLALTALGFLGLFFYYIITLPQFHQRINSIKSGIYLASVFVALFSLLNEVVESAGVGLLGVFLYPLFFITGYLASSSRRSSIFKHVAQGYSAERQEDIAEGESFSFALKSDVFIGLRAWFNDTSRPTMLSCEQLYRHGLKNYSFSPQLKLLQGYYLVVAKRSNVEATRHISKYLSAQRLEGAPLDVFYSQYQLSILRERWLAPVMGEQSIDFQKRMFKAMRAYVKTLERVELFWTVLLQDDPDLNVLPRISESIRKNQETAKQHFVEILTDYPQSPIALSKFALFCKEVMNDPSTAFQINQLVEELEGGIDQDEEASVASSKKYAKELEIKYYGENSIFTGTASSGSTNTKSVSGYTDVTTSTEGTTTTIEITSGGGAGQAEHNDNARRKNAASILRIVVVFVLGLVMAMSLFVYFYSTSALNGASTEMVNVKRSAERLGLNQAIAITSILFGLEVKYEHGSVFYYEKMRGMLDRLSAVHATLASQKTSRTYEPLRRLNSIPSVSLTEYYPDADNIMHPVTQNYSMFSAGNKLIQVGYEYLDMTYEESLVNNPNTNRLYRFILENGAFPISEMMVNALDMYVNYVEILFRNLLLTRIILLLISILLLFLVDVVLFRPVLTRITKKRCQTLQLFLSIPAHSIQQLCRTIEKQITTAGFNSEGQSRLMKKLQQEGSLTKSQGKDKKQELEKWRVFPRHHYGLLMIGLLIFISWLVAFIFFERNLAPPYEVSASGRRLYLARLLHTLSYIAGLNRTTWMPGDLAIEQIGTVRTEFLALHYDLVNGITKGIYSERGVTNELLFNSSCLRSDLKCGPENAPYKFGITLSYRGLDELLVSYAANLAAFTKNPNMTAENFNTINQAGFFDLPDGLASAVDKYIAEGQNEADSQIQVEFIMLWISLIVCVLVYLATFHPQVKEMHKEIVLTDNLVTLIPDEIVQKVEVLKDYLETGQLIEHTEEMYAKSQLAKSRAQMMRLLEVVTEAVIVFTPEGEITSVNDALVRMVSFSFDELLGKNFADLFVLPEAMRKRIQQVEITEDERSSSEAKEEDDSLLNFTSEKMEDHHQKVLDLLNRFKGGKLAESIMDSALSIVTKEQKVIPTLVCFSEFSFGSERVMVALIKDQTQLLMTERALKTAAAEREKSDTLLYNMMPAEVANALRMGKKILPQKHDNVTLFFSDIQGFTSLSSQVTPAEMIGMLDRMWTIYDALAPKFSIHKVETIGDAYFGSCGCPNDEPDHAEHIVDFSLHIVAAFSDFKTPLDEIIKIRIGVHSGSVVTGVLGSLVPHYTLVGDAVNTCARMEQTGTPGKVHVSGETMQQIASVSEPNENAKYKIEECPPIEVKGKGQMITYFVEPVCVLNVEEDHAAIETFTMVSQKSKLGFEDFAKVGKSLETQIEKLRTMISPRSNTSRQTSKNSSSDMMQTLSVERFSAHSNNQSPSPSLSKYINYSFDSEDAGLSLSASPRIHRGRGGKIISSPQVRPATAQEMRQLDAPSLTETSLKMFSLAVEEHKNTMSLADSSNDGISNRSSNSVAVVDHSLHERPSSFCRDLKKDQKKKKGQRVSIALESFNDLHSPAARPDSAFDSDEDIYSPTHRSTKSLGL
eukprot:GCRY01005103.1.p1 GENE.GCRY01005103.1~~GCRY01005103.1.p1  ORF type:complete len:1762 (-),score=212.97 GCRY01005103.1:21-5276(-)